MRIVHLTQSDYKVGHWSGGTTTELFIWPPQADYAKREFSFRISSAAVELAESDFTPLPGVERWITPLRGGFTLSHPGKAPVVMEPLAQPYRFSGDISTHCVGLATDFNLMLKAVSGEMAVCRGETAVLPGFNCFYAVEDAIFRLEGEHRMAAGDLLAVFSRQKAAIELGDTPVIVCHAEVGTWENM